MRDTRSASIRAPRWAMPLRTQHRRMSSIPADDRARRQALAGRVQALSALTDTFSSTTQCLPVQLTEPCLERRELRDGPPSVLLSATCDDTLVKRRRAGDFMRRVGYIEGPMEARSRLDIVSPFENDEYRSWISLTRRAFYPVSSLSNLHGSVRPCKVDRFFRLWGSVTETVIRPPLLCLQAFGS
jgi:hypothetical protein